MLCECSSPSISNLCSESQSHYIQDLSQRIQVSKSAQISKSAKFLWNLRKFRIFPRKFRTSCGSSGPSSEVPDICGSFGHLWKFRTLDLLSLKSYIPLRPLSLKTPISTSSAPLSPP